MPLYLSRFSYTPETWARMIRNPDDRRLAAQSYIESVGGKLHGFWYAFGTHDGYNLWEAPDNVSMAAVALAIAGGGALSSFETIVLMTVDERWTPCARPAKFSIERPVRSGSSGDSISYKVCSIKLLPSPFGKPILYFLVSYLQSPPNFVLFLPHYSQARSQELGTVLNLDLFTFSSQFWLIVCCKMTYALYFL
jgi:uncharacterized protein with GYD domain